MQRARLFRLTLLGLLAILAASLFAPAAAMLEPASIVAAADDDDRQDWPFDDVPLAAAPRLAGAEATPHPLPLPTCTAATPSPTRVGCARGPPEA